MVLSKFLNLSGTCQRTTLDGDIDCQIKILKSVPVVIVVVVIVVLFSSVNAVTLPELEDLS